MGGLPWWVVSLVGAISFLFLIVSNLNATIRLREEARNRLTFLERRVLSLGEVFDELRSVEHDGNTLRQRVVMLERVVQGLNDQVALLRLEATVRRAIQSNPDLNLENMKEEPVKDEAPRNRFDRV